MQRTSRIGRPQVKGSAKAALLMMAEDVGFPLTATGVSTTEVELSWKGVVPTPDNYRVERSLDGSSFSTVTTLPNTDVSYTDTGRTESVQYWYRLVPILGGIDQTPSTIADTWTVPATPTTLTATAASSSQINLAWTDVSTGNTGYNIERRTPPTTGTYAVVGTAGATATSFSSNGLVASTQYEFRVAATNPATQSAYSNAATATTNSATLPAAPTGVSASASTTAVAVTITWTDASTDEDNFNVYRNTTNTTVGATIINSPLAGIQTYTDNATNNPSAPPVIGTTYYYWVSASNGAGESAKTAASQNATGGVTTLNVPAAPTSLTATATSSTQINLAWTDNATNETGYIVERRSPAGSGSYSQIATPSAGATSYSDTGLTASTQYEYRVAATNAAGNSSYSNAASATTQSGALTPSWSLDFSTGTPSGYTLTRASSGTYVDSSGYVASASTDVARLTHERASPYSRLGLLIEESRTNTFQRSQEFDNAYWTKTGLLAFGSGSTANAATAPDNTTTADLITEDSGGTAGHFVQRGSLTFNASTSYTMSMFVKKPSSNARDFVTFVFSGASNHRLVRTFDLADGTSTRNNWAGANFSTESSGSEQYRDGWWRLWISVTIGGTNVTSVTAGVATATSETPTLIGAGTYPNHAGDGVSGLLLWGAQLGANATPSSYISTTTASVTRSADLVHVLDSAITGWQDPGALVVHFYPPPQTGALLSTDDASAEQLGIEASSTTAVRAFWSNGQTNPGTMTTGVQKAVHYWNGTASSFCLNGGTVETGTNNVTTFGNIDFVTFGAQATDSAGSPGTFTDHSNLIIRKIEFYSGTLTSGDLQTITT